MSKIKEGDLVKVRDYDTGLIGLVVDMIYHQNATPGLKNQRRVKRPNLSR